MEYKFVTFEDLVSIIDVTQPVMYDSETIGLYGRIRLTQFYQRHFPCALFIEYPNPMELVGLLSKLKIVGHNIHYDITTIQEQLGNLTWMPEEFHCTFLLSRLKYYKEEGFSLDKVMQYVLGFNPYPNKKDMQDSDWGAIVLSEDQLVYAATDVVHLYDVWDNVKEYLDDISYKLDLLTTRYCLDFQNNGMPVDIGKIQEQYSENMTEINKLGLPINCNSPKQVRDYIGSTLSDAHGLSLLTAQGNERAKIVNETRKLTKQNSFLTKFMTTLKESGNGYGDIFGKFLCSPRSGRLASKDQNLQQIPRKLKIIFGLDPDGDEIMLFSDFAQIQLRGVCVVTGDRPMERLFRSGADLHNYVAEMIFGKDFTKTHRQISKTANFGLLFGAGIVVFLAILLKEAGLWLKEEEGTRIKKLWGGCWPQIAAWQQKGIKSWKKGEAWETPLGRRYTAKMMTDQLAMQIQGFEAEVAKLALHYMWPKMLELNKEIPDDKPKMRLRNFIHDCYIWTGWKNEEIYKKAALIIAECMQEAWKEMCQSVVITDLPMPTKVRVGYNWGDIEKDKFIYELSI